MLASEGDDPNTPVRRFLGKTRPDGFLSSGTCRRAIWHHRPAPGTAGVRGAVGRGGAVLPPAPYGETGADGLGAGDVPVWGIGRGCAGEVEARLLYIKHQGLYLDLLILIQTVLRVE